MLVWSKIPTTYIDYFDWMFFLLETVNVFLQQMTWLSYYSWKIVRET